MKKEYDQSIKQILKDKMRSKGALIDADKQTSGISGINTTSMNQAVN